MPVWAVCGACIDREHADAIAATVEGFEGRLLLDLDRSDLDARDLAAPVTLTLDRGGVPGERPRGIDRHRPLPRPGVVLDGFGETCSSTPSART